MAPDGENPRGINAVKLLEGINKLNLDDLIKIGYNKHLAAFDILLPPFIEFANQINLTEQQKKAIQYLANWNHDADTNSIAQTIAITWATELGKSIPAAETEEEGTQLIKKYENINKINNNSKLNTLDNILSQLDKTYGSWEIPWGKINKYQRVKLGDYFKEAAWSISVAQASSKWGQLPAFESRVMPTANALTSTKYRYGYSGNSFVAAVSFGKKLEAKTIITGGQSFDSTNKHFTDQAQMYIDGNFKNIYFYKEDVLAHKVTSYKPGFER
jgi:acyl-homoserine lactone acylase PvdQ